MLCYNREHKAKGRRTDQERSNHNTATHSQAQGHSSTEASDTSNHADTKYPPPRHGLAQHSTVANDYSTSRDSSRARFVCSPAECSGEVDRSGKCVEQDGQRRDQAGVRSNQSCAQSCQELMACVQMCQKVLPASDDMVTNLLTSNVQGAPAQAEEVENAVTGVMINISMPKSGYLQDLLWHLE
jgi:hypothetical protein